MIALCLQCHKEADGGAFTDSQLRDLKTNPFLKRAGVGPAGHFNWKREQLILAAGNSLFVRCPVFLEVRGRRIIWLSSDDAGNQLLNLDIWDERGQLAMSMRNNDWLVGADLDDVEAPPGAHSLVVRAPSRGFRVSIEFEAVTVAELTERLRRREEETAASSRQLYEGQLAQQIAAGAPAMVSQSFRDMIERAHDQIDTRTVDLTTAIARGWSGNEFVLCNFLADIPYPVRVQVEPSKITLPGNNTIGSMVAIDCGGAISVG
jgi:hypothetical protein